MKNQHTASEACEYSREHPDAIFIDDYGCTFQWGGSGTDFCFYAHPVATWEQYGPFELVTEHANHKTNKRGGV